MITTVCLNPAIDQSVSVDRLRVGEVNRLRTTHTVIGGKGINVAIVLKRLHAAVNCVGLIGEADAPFFTRGMEAEGAEFHAIRIPGGVRRNLKITDTADHSVTEFNEQGAQVDAAALVKLTGALVKQAGNNRYIALCGSLPPGCGQDTYQTIMRSMQDKRWVVDTSGDALRHALREKPFLIKPNLAELEELTGTRLKTLQAVRDAAVKLCESGVSYATVSLGERGAILTDGQKTVFTPAVKVPPASALGAGDAMLAGLLFGIERGETAFESLLYGVAAGSACVQGGGIHWFRERDFKALLSGVEIQAL